MMDKICYGPICAQNISVKNNLMKGIFLKIKKSFRCYLRYSKEKEYHNKFKIDKNFN
jgi:hypothetical protein